MQRNNHQYKFGDKILVKRRKNSKHELERMGQFPITLIKKESDIFEFLFPGDGATISRVPLLNILVLGKKLLVTILELVDWQGHLADGGKQNGIFICNRFLEHIKRTDPHKSITDVVMFDGASNV